MRNIFYVILCTFYFTNLSSSTTDTVESEWIDPGDMLRSSKLKTYSREQSEELSKSFCSSVSEKLTLCNAELLKKNCSEKLIKKDVCDGPYVKMIARSLVQKLSSWILQTSEHYFITIALTSSQLSTLINFIEAKEGNIHDVSHFLSNMIEKSNIKMEVDEGWNLHLINIFGISLSTFLQILTIFTVFTLFIYLQMRVRISWIQFFFHCLILLFFISIPWNWLHMYKKALAKKHSDMLKILPKECQPEDLSLMQTFGRWLRSTVTLTVSKTDACTQYHEALLVDPLWEVAPTQAIAVTITKFIVQPFEHIGEAFNKFLRGTLDGLPAYISLIVLFILILVIVLILIMLCSYRVHVPFLGGLEPFHMPLSIGNEQHQYEEKIVIMESPQTKKDNVIEGNHEIQYLEYKPKEKGHHHHHHRHSYQDQAIKYRSLSKGNGGHVENQDIIKINEKNSHVHKPHFRPPSFHHQHCQSENEVLFLKYDNIENINMEQNKYDLKKSYQPCREASQFHSTDSSLTCELKQKVPNTFPVPVPISYVPNIKK